jgi:hypothetical protein
LAEVLIAKIIIMKELFFMGGSTFMATLSILLIIMCAWIIYQFVVAYKSDQINQEKALGKIAYGKTIGLFAMFNAVQQVYSKGEAIRPELVYGGIKVTMICAMYGILIYLFALLLWFVASIIIEKKFNK